MIHQFGEVEGGISFCHLLDIGFLRVSLIYFLSNLVEYATKGIISSHHHLSGSKKSWPISSKEYIDLGLTIATWKYVYHDKYHAFHKSCRGLHISSIRFNFAKGKVLWPDNGLRELTHILIIKMDQPQFKVLKSTCTNHLLWQLILLMFVQPSHSCGVGCTSC